MNDDREEIDWADDIHPPKDLEMWALVVYRPDGSGGLTRLDSQRGYGPAFFSCPRLAEQVAARLTKYDRFGNFYAPIAVRLSVAFLESVAQVRANAVAARSELAEAEEALARAENEFEAAKSRARELARRRQG